MSKVIIGAQVDKELKDEIKACALSQDKTVSELIREALKKFLASQKEVE